MAEFLKNTTTTLITRIMTIVLGMLATVVIARALGPQGQGIYSLATLLPGLILVLSNFGLGMAAVFHVGRKEYPAKVVFGSSILLAVTIGVVTLAGGAATVHFWGSALFPGVEPYYLYLALLLLPFYIFFDIASSILLGLQRIGKYNAVTLLQPLLFLALAVLLLLGAKYRIGAAIVAQTVSFAIAGGFLFLMVVGEIGRPSAKFSRKYFNDAALYGLKSWLASVFNFLHYRADLFLINFFMNPAATGIYYAATRIAEGTWLLSTSAGTVLLPRVAAETDADRLKKFTPFVCRNIFYVTFLLALAVFLLSRWLVVFFYSEEFIEAVYSLQILLIGNVFISGWRILANDIAARGKPMVNTYIIGVSLLVNVFLNIIFIPKFGISGAAWATSISYFLVFAATVFVYGNISGNRAGSVLFLQKEDFKFYRNFLSAALRYKKL
ncbi:MAG: flippase [Candidatus Pacebacteria bacterium]|nr:flippase [Candidatus Paceibacterota bacterium]